MILLVWTIQSLGITYMIQSGYMVNDIDSKMPIPIPCLIDQLRSFNAAKDLKVQEGKLFSYFSLVCSQKDLVQ